MTAEKWKLELFFEENLKNDWFKKAKKFRTWYKKTDNNTFFVINLQKSRFANKFFINVWIKYEWIKRSTWDEKKPEVDNTNTHSRIEMYDKDYDSKIVQNLLWWIDNNSDNLLITEVYNYILLFFNKNSTKENFKENYYEYYMLDNVAIGSPLEDYCETNSSRPPRQ